MSRTCRSPPTPTTCYDTFTAAIAAATGGQITDAPANSRVAMNDQRLLARLNASGDKKSTAAIQENVPVGIIFYEAAFQGPSVSFLEEPATTYCTRTPKTPDTELPYVGDYWNDNFSSFIAFNNCWGKVWEHRDFGGVSTPWARRMGDIGIEGSALAFD